MLPRYPVWFSTTFSGPTFLLVGPPPVGNGGLVVFRPVLGLGHLEKFRARAKNIKTQFPEARGPETEKKSYHAVRDGFMQLFYILRFGAGKREIRGFWAILA